MNKQVTKLTCKFSSSYPDHVDSYIQRGDIPRGTDSESSASYFAEILLATNQIKHNKEHINLRHFS